MSDAGRTMRAAWYESQGAPGAVLQVGEMPVPEPGQGEVRVRVAVSGVNLIDTKKRSGVLGKMSFPRIIPHSDGAGTIESVGEGVDERRVGQRVWLLNAQSRRPRGTAAEYTVVPAAFAVRLPVDVDFDVGASLGIPARTAWLALFEDGTIQGSSILVAGAAGTVGRCAVELAHLAGGHVIATVRDDDGAREVRRLGAALVLNPARDDVFARVQGYTEGEGVDRIVETALAANAEADLEMLAEGGTIAAYASDTPDAVIPFWKGVAKGARLRFISVDLIESDQLLPLPHINRAIAAGGLRPKVAERFPLDRIADAHALVEERAGTGKVLVDI